MRYMNYNNNNNNNNQVMMKSSRSNGASITSADNGAADH